MAKKIILVHGLGGTAHETWGRFPSLLMEDKDIDYEIISCGYESPSLWQFWKRAPSIFNVANGVLTDIGARCDLDNDEIILAGHSLGGLIIRKVLLLLKNRGTNHRISKVCFFDVPHDGSGYANVGKYLSFRNRHLGALTRDSSELDDLNEQWVSSGLNRSLDILSIVSANDDIVSSLSSKSIFREHPIETINDVNHRTIVKPKSVNCSSYILFKRFILKKNSVTKYKTIASRDLADWKSVERNHGYTYSADEKREKDFTALVEALKLPKAVIRLTGAAGLGKTRLLIEAIAHSESIDQSSVIIFSDPGYDSKIWESVRSMVDDQVCGLVVIENCSVDLHNRLAREVKKKDCSIRLVTIGYFHDQVDDSVHIQLSPLDDDAIRRILSPVLVQLGAGDIDRVARFAQGYPLIATLIAEQYQKEGRLLGSIESQSIVKKLIEGDGGITDEEKEVLSACSLFDVFGVAEGKAGEEAIFIAVNVAGSEMRVFDRVLAAFTKRQIISRAGRYARLVPKPLALTLASEWWESTSYERQKQLIEELPDSLIQSFCIQAAYLDHQPNVQRFSDRLFGGDSPFVKAEELLTERGSKLFRAFVEVNPESTSDALYRVLSECNLEELKQIAGETRRNLVWALEKLCFHAIAFEKSSWCMLLLASAENEHWSNNATGMFAQLFRVNLSGTQAKPNVRFDLLRRAIELGQSNVDMVVLKALEQSISTYGGTRTIGAEYQGTKAPLQEWRPKQWQEIFDFWQQAFDLMLILLERGEKQKEEVISIIGNSIRGLAINGRVEMLDAAIKRVVTINGRYWPQALNSIKHTFEYDTEGMRQEVLEALGSWLELLNPKDAELPEKIKILVTDSPWEHHKEDGSYIDIAAENAKALATELSKNIEELFPHVPLLLIGQQKQSYVFGCQLAHELDTVEPLLNYALQCLVTIDNPDSGLIAGLLNGIYLKSPELWQKRIDQLLDDERLVIYYPRFLRSGKLKKFHLESLIGLVSRGLLSPNVVFEISYGRVTEAIEPHAITEFCLQLAELGNEASWQAFNVVYMYCYDNQSKIDEIREQLKQLTTTVPLHSSQYSIGSGLHSWYDLAQKLLNERDQQFAAALTLQLISATRHGLNHGDIWSYTKPFMLRLMKDYGDTLWPIIGEAVVRSDDKQRYWLQQLLDREDGLVADMPSVLSVIPVSSVIQWCSQNPGLGPAFVARCLNIFEKNDEQKLPSPLLIALLENFGNDHQVRSELSANMRTRGWSGSLVPYLKSDKAALTSLIEHGNASVRSWVKDQLLYIEQQIDQESTRDEEYGFGIYR